MIQLRSIIDISDNTGAQKGQCIKIFNKTKKLIGTTGDIILVAIKKTKNKTEKISKSILNGKKMDINGVGFYSDILEFIDGKSSTEIIEKIKKGKK